MLLDVRRGEGVVVVAPSGPALGLSTAEDFRDDVLDLVEAGNRRIVVDLAAVASIDSEGLGALVLLMKRVAVDGALALCNVREAPRSILRLTRLDRVLRVYPDEAEARRAVAA